MELSCTVASTRGGWGMKEVWNGLLRCFSSMGDNCISCAPELEAIDEARERDAKGRVGGEKMTDGCVESVWDGDIVRGVS